ncbi:mandelate racemase/muconate lactonizing enzyme family protein [Mameliella alba]|nr:mandelate racemase/muconate lactonizing enzyme family protein [Mameliella alba]MCA0956845.1 mandelate racemase/muconate lactonizing enzyme family protein [Mameliella alba]
MTILTPSDPLTRLDVHVFRVPLARPVRTSFGAMRDRPAVFLRLEDSSGAFGWGEIFANWPAAGAEHRARLLVEDLADLFIGQSYDRQDGLFVSLTRQTHIRALQSREWGPFDQAIAGLDIAYHDLLARKASLPFAKFLSADAPDSVPTYASGIDIREAEEVIAACRERGHRAFKVKVGFELGDDVARLIHLADNLGTSENLMADVNQGWDLDQARHALRRLAKCPLTWVEEPIAADAPKEHWQSLARESWVPLAGGENIAGLSSFMKAIETLPLAVMQPDVIKWGGISGCEKVARAAIARGISYCPHFLGGGVGLLASAGLLAAVGGDGLLECDVNPNPLRDAFLRTGNVGPADRLPLPASLGLGFDTFPDCIAEFQTLHAVATVSGFEYHAFG